MGNPTGAPQNVKWDGALSWDGAGTIYVVRGDNKNDFWAYNISTSTWTDLAAAPGNLNAGGAVAYSEGAVYVLRGANTPEFWKYTVSAGSWESLSDAPGGLERGGGSIAGDGGEFIYALKGNGSSDFWRYDIGDDR